jgi:hypothetical protein
VVEEGVEREGEEEEEEGVATHTTTPLSRGKLYARMHISMATTKAF